jgi:hypothetical protein
MANSTPLPFPHPRDCPTQAEILFHKNEIKILEEDIYNLENEINKLQARLQHLQQKKANHCSYISPLRRLPPELMSEIVHICLANKVQLTTLTQICGTIRDIVVGMSALWKYILIRPINPGPISDSDPTWVSVFFA